MATNDIISKMDELDVFMLNNIDGINGLFKRETKPEEILDANKKISEIKNEINGISGNGRLKARFKSLENAFLSTLGEKDKDDSKMYFTWLEDSKKDFEQIKDPNEALTILINAVNIQRLPKQEIIDHLMQEANENKDIAKNMDRLLYPINAISKIGKVQESNKMIAPEKTPFFRRIINKLKNIFAKKEQEVNKTTTIDDIPPTISVPKEKKPLNDFHNSIQVQEQPKIEPETLCISDLHGNMDLWNATKQRLARNSESKLIVLGDAMDRGQYGPEILLQIKDLCDKGKAIYIPGNHDAATYNYLKTYNDPNLNKTDIFMEAEYNWLHNGGEATREKMIHYFNQIAENCQSKCTLEELVNWLGKQPIQRAATIGNQRYALSHAQFDEKLYKDNPNFCLEDGLELLKTKGRENQTYQQFNEVLWYREGATNATSKEQGTIYLIGHTPQENVKLSDGEKGYAILNLDTHSSNAKFSAYNLNNNKSIELADDVNRTR